MKRPTQFSHQPLIGLLFLALLSLSAQVHAATFSVTEPSCRTTPGGYEWAIEQANSTPGRDTISIDVPDFAVDDCTHLTSGSGDSDLPIAITESVDIVGNGNSVTGNVLWTASSGHINPGGCPAKWAIRLWIDYGGALLQIGDFDTGAAGIEVTVTGLDMRDLTRVAYIRENGALTIENAEIKDVKNVIGGCSGPIIDAQRGADLTLRQTRILGASVPSTGYGSTQFQMLTSLISGYKGDLVMEDVSVIEGKGGGGVTAAGIHWVGGTVKVVNSLFNGGNGFWLVDSEMEFVNSAYILAGVNAHFSDNIVLQAGATLTTQGSTFHWGALECTNCNVTKGSGSSATATRGLGFVGYPQAGYPLPSVRFESTALGSVDTPAQLPLQHLWGDPQVFSSDAYTWIQPTTSQDAAELAAILPRASTATPGLTTQIKFAQRSVTEVTPIIPGVLVEAVPDADTGGVNELLNPIDGQPITTDLLSSPRVYANGTRNIGAVQNTDAPPLSAIPDDAKVTLNWAATVGGQQNGYELCTSTTELDDPLTGTCPGTLTTAGATETSTTITSLTNGSPYWFAIRVPSGIWSKVATATPMGQLGVAQPTTVVPGPGGDSLWVYWAEPATLGGHQGLLSYNVLYRPLGTQTWVLGPQGITTPRRAELTGLVNGTTYEIGIFAQTADGGLSPTFGTINGTTVAAPTLSYAKPATWPQNTPLTLTPTVSQLQGAGLYTIAGGALPDGMTIDSSTGVISGTPTTQQSTSATIFLIDQSSGELTTATVALNIVAPSPGPQLWYPSIQATVGTGPVSATPTQSNIPGGAIYSVVASESLPAGFSIDATTGVVSGTPTSAPGRVVSVDIQACWGGCNPTAGEVRIAPMLFYILPRLQYPANTNATAGVAVTITPTVDLWSGGVFSITAGSLPAGMSLDTSTGLITGTPQTVLNAQLTVRYSTGVNVTGLEYVFSGTQINVASPSIVLIYPAVSGTVGKDLTVTPTVTGLSGTALYTLVSGPLPPGLSLNPATGVITGVPTGPAGSFPVVIQVTDPYGSQRTSVVIELHAAAVSVPTVSPPVLALLAILMTLTAGLARRRRRVRH